MRRLRSGVLAVTMAAFVPLAVPVTASASTYPFFTPPGYHVTYPVVMGDVALGKLYGGVLGLPEAFLITPDGKILKNWRGDFKPGELDTAIAAALRDSKSQ